MSFKLALGAVATALVLSLGVAVPSVHASPSPIFLLDGQTVGQSPDFGVSTGTVVVESNDPGHVRRRRGFRLRLQQL